MSSRPTSPATYDSLASSQQPSLSTTLVGSQHPQQHQQQMGGAGGSGQISPPGISPSGSAASVGGGAPAGKAQPLYAIVQYDFEAERPDELDAKAGEPIIVIAQSNHEWFVAKPIGRLGGPGLIPVSFVEIRDPRTSRPVENVQELLATGSVPQVEAWKKATAEYKAASIPLGQFDFSSKQGVQNSPYMQAPSMGPRQDSAGQSSIQSAGSHASWARHQRASSQMQQMQSGQVIPGAATQTDAQLMNGEVISTHVKSFHYEASSYWFRINAIFMPDDPTLQAISLVLYRLYEDFYNFQITLLDLFPSEAGRSEPSSAGGQGSPPAGRILPYMPGPLDKVDVDVTNQRREELDTYLKELLDLRNIGAGYILRHDHVLGFFSPGAGDQAESLDRIDAEAVAMRTMGDGGGTSSHHVSSQAGLEERLADMQVGGGGNGVGGGRVDEVRRSVGSGRYSPMPPNVGQGAGFDGRSSGGSGSRSQSQLSGNINGPPAGLAGGRQAGYRNTGGSSSAAHDSPNNSRGQSPLPPQEGSSQGHLYPNQGGAFSPPIHTASTQSSFGHSRTGSNTMLAPNHTGGGGAVGGQAASAGAAAAAAAGAGGQQPAFIKIKILERTTDDMIAIRVPPRVTFEQLMQKVRDRLGSQVGRVQYRQSGGAGAGGAGAFRDVADDESLRDWLGKEDKLVLYAD